MRANGNTLSAGHNRVGPDEEGRLSDVLAWSQEPSTGIVALVSAS